jgi:hypothetical protein
MWQYKRYETTDAAEASMADLIARNAWCARKNLTAYFLAVVDIVRHDIKALICSDVEAAPRTSQ